MVNVQTEHLENHTARITVTLEPELLEKAMRQAARRISQKSRIPGFRPGKAPYEIVLNLFGREYVLEEALKSLVNEVYSQALEMSQITPYGPGSLEEIRDDGYTLVFVVPKAPTVELGDYQAIRVESESPEVTDEQVNTAMEWLRQNQALVEPVERPAKVGDEVILEHLTVELVSEGQPAEASGEAQPQEETPGEETTPEDEEDDNLVQHEHDFSVILFEDNRELYHGFTAQIVGLSAGEEKEFTLTMPEDYDEEELAGKTLRFNVKVGQVNARTVPEWSDDLAKRISEGRFETMLELRMDLRKKLQEFVDEQAREVTLSEALVRLVESATFHFPEEMVQDVVSDMMHEFEAERLSPEGLTLQDYLTVTGRSEDDLRQILRPAAINRIKGMLAFREFMHREQVTVSNEEVEAEIDRMSESFGEHASVLRRLLATEPNRSNVTSELLTARASDRLVAIARGEAEQAQGDVAPAESETVAASTEEPAAVETNPVTETVATDEASDSAGQAAEQN